MPHNPPQLFLVDGYGLIYRAFYAMMARPLRTSKGENTSAALGVANFLVRLREKYRPDYLAWINDAGDSFRTEIYPEYKSTRTKLDEELQVDFNRSVERIGQLLKAFRIPMVSLDGYEADDVIGTLAERAVERGFHAIIVSGDKDFYQLIRPGVSILNPGRGGSAQVEEQWIDRRRAVQDECAREARESAARLGRGRSHWATCKDPRSRVADEDRRQVRGGACFDGYHRGKTRVRVERMEGVHLR